MENVRLARGPGARARKLINKDNKLKFETLVRGLVVYLSYKVGTGSIPVRSVGQGECMTRMVVSKIVLNLYLMMLWKRRI